MPTLEDHVKWNELIIGKHLGQYMCIVSNNTMCSKCCVCISHYYISIPSGLKPTVEQGASWFIYSWDNLGKGLSETLGRKQLSYYSIIGQMEAERILPF